MTKTEQNRRFCWVFVFHSRPHLFVFEDSRRRRLVNRVERRKPRGKDFSSKKSARHEFTNSPVPQNEKIKKLINRDTIFSDIFHERNGARKPDQRNQDHDAAGKTKQGFVENVAGIEFQKI